MACSHYFGASPEHVYNMLTKERALMTVQLALQPVKRFVHMQVLKQHNKQVFSVIHPGEKSIKHCEVFCVAS